MTEMLLAMVAAMTLLLPSVATAAPSETQLVAPFVEGELLVGLDPELSASETEEVHRVNGASLIRRFPEINVDLVRIGTGVNVPQAVSRYRFDASVRFAEPNYLRTFDATIPNDPQFNQQWALNNTGQDFNGDPGNTPDADIDATDAWSINPGSPAPIVAIIDTGIQVTHADLNDNLWVNPDEVPGNGVDDDGNGYVDDANGWDFLHRDGSVFDSGNTCSGNQEDFHGTHIAGIIGAEGDNSIGVAGVNWDVRLMSLKFIGRIPSGSDCVGADSDAIEAMLYAARHGADVVNLSWGGSLPEEALRQAMIAASDAGILWAVAAGNTGGDLTASPQYPGGFDLENEIVVASSTNDDTLSSFSSFGGPTDLAAPGSTILSTFPTGTYALLGGTSMAAPHVAGALALLRAQYPHAPPSELKERVLTTVDLKPAFAPGKTQTGGRLNIHGALSKVLPVIPTMVSPNGGEKLIPGSTRTISWDPNIPPGNPLVAYRLEYTVNNFASTSEANNFEAGVPPSFSEPADSDAPWISATPSRPGSGGTLSLRAGAVTDNKASWVTTSRRLSQSGTISFWYRVSSEICAGTDCGDFLRFFVDGVRMLSRAGDSGWNQVSFPIPAGSHTFSWAYQKDALTTAGSDTAWIDDVAFTGLDNVAWNPLTTTAAGASSFGWLVPNSPTGSAKVRVCANTGPNCVPASSDESDEVFAIVSCPVLNPSFLAFDPAFTGGIYVAAGDLNGDGCDEVIVGAGSGGEPRVRAFAASGLLMTDLLAYPSGFTGGVRVAAGDVDGDGKDELITGAGPGGGPHVRIWDLSGSQFVEQSGFFAYPAGFYGGVWVAAGDVGGTDSRAEVITGAGESGGPHVRIMTPSGGDLGGFFAYPDGFYGGVMVAAGDVSGGAKAEIVTGAGPSGGPHVRIFNIAGADLGGFFAYSSGFYGGVFVGAGDVVPGGPAEVVTGAGESGGAHVRVFSAGGGDLGGFFAYPDGFYGGVRVAVGDSDGDGDLEIVTGPGPSGGPQVRIFE